MRARKSNPEWKEKAGDCLVHIRKISTEEGDFERYQENPSNP